MDNEQDISADTAHGVAYAGVGARLRAAREARRLELTTIASETRIPLRHLEVIEAGDFAALPSRAYAIGFARTFAKAVGLDDAAITDGVRAELADGSARRSAVGSGMEPGDPAKLPSAGLAWFGAFAALVLAVGLIAFFSTRFGAGMGPAPLAEPPKPAPSIAAAPAAATAPATGGPVIITAREDVWVRIYEEGGERLIEKQLAKDESFTVPATAADPRINTGRPDLLAITIGGKPVPALSDKPETLSGMPVSAAALLARAQGQTGAVASAVPATISRPAQRRTAPRPVTTPLVAEQTPAPAATTEAPAPPPASEPAAEAPTG
jgi:cytoskeleton protein RodZ